jgi:hypothetical protein
MTSDRPSMVKSAKMISGDFCSPQTKEVFTMDDFLFAVPTFIRDMGRSIDLGDTMTSYNKSESPAEADMRALRNDWFVVGTEIRQATESLAGSYVE